VKKIKHGADFFDARMPHQVVQPTELTEFVYFTIVSAISIR
jgi:hypothetical protein